ncbi:MAG: hypothetical protein MZU79_04070 [Anaerotruncus sp.]|nr:hypothetical protein [Anaerotruncus sp.]
MAGYDWYLDGELPVDGRTRALRPDPPRQRPARHPPDLLTSSTQHTLTPRKAFLPGLFFACRGRSPFRVP